MNRLEAAAQFRRALQLVAMGLTEEKAVQVTGIYDPWEPGKAYTPGDFVTHEGRLYKVLQAHNSQSDWTPEAAVSLFAPVEAAV